MATHEIDSGDDVAAVFASGAAGDTYSFGAGPHRVAGPFTMRNGDILTSPDKSSARLTGSIVISSWSKQGAQWVADVSNGQKENNELFFANNVLPKRKVAGSPAAGQWSYDTGSNRVYVGDDPSGTEVELSVAPRIIHTNATNLLIENLIIEKSATQYQTGMIQSTNESNAAWTLKNLEIRYSNATGYRQPGGLSTATRCNFHHNSQMNVVGGSKTPGAGLFFCEFAYGNYYLVNPIGHEAGCMKIVASHNFSIKNCWSHHNQGIGFWFDINNWKYTVEDCISEDERWMGYYFEIGHDGVIRRNLARRCANNVPPEDSLWDVVWAGFSAGATHDVTFEDNICEDCPRGFVGFQQNRPEYQPESDEPYHNPNHWMGGTQIFTGSPHDDGAHRVWNTLVKNNTYARGGSGGQSGIASDAGGASLLNLERTNEQNNAYEYCAGRIGSNRWVGNHYYIVNGGHNDQWSFYWNQGNAKTWDEWQVLGQDAGGTYQSYAEYTPSPLIHPVGWDDVDPPIDPPVDPPPTGEGGITIGVVVTATCPNCGHVWSDTPTHGGGQKGVEKSTMKVEKK